MLSGQKQSRGPYKKPSVLAPVRQHRGISIEAAKKSIPLGRTGSCREAAGGVLLLCLPESDYITGQLLEVDGGLAL